MCTKKRILSWLLVCVMLLGIMPTRVMAAMVSESLALGEEKQVSITEPGDEVTYTYTADEAGKYIIYFKDLSDNPIGLGFQPEQEQYYHQLENQFQGHVIDLNAGENTFLTFMYPIGDFGEDYHGYTATVGVATPVAESDFEGFAALGNMLPAAEADGPSVRVALQNGQRVFHFFTKQPLAYGVNWSVSCDNTDVLELDEANTSSTPANYSPAFILKAEGIANITITAQYGSVIESATYSVAVVQGEEGGGNGNHEGLAFFDDFDSLKALVEDTDQTQRVLVYRGTEALTVASDLEIPGYFQLQLEGKDLVVPEGVTLTAHNWIECGSLYVAGTLNAMNRINCRGSVDISGTVNADFAIGLGHELSVTGALYAGEWNVNMQHPATVNGIENISFRDDWQKVQVEVPFDSVDELDARLLELFQIPSVPEKMSYYLHIPEYQDVTFEMDRDLTIPPYATLQMENCQSFLLEAGNLLINSNMIDVNVPFIVKGNIENQGCLNVNHLDGSTGQIIFEDGSEYSGSGNIQVHSIEKNLDELIPGFDYDGFNIHSEVEGDFNVRHWFVYRDGNGGGNHGDDFETLDELIQEINKDDQSNRNLYAIGTGAFEITQDLVIPEHLEVYFNDRDVIIEEGVNVVLDGWTSCQNLTVKGHLTLNRWMECNNSVVIEPTGTFVANTGFNAGYNLDVQGELIIERDSFDMKYPAQINGMDNIQWSDDWLNIYISGRYNNAEELKALLDAMSSDYLEYEHLIYCIDPQWHDEENARVIQIAEDLTIPGHVELRFYSNYEFILEENATITNEGEISFNIPAVVKGSVVNEGAIFVNNNEDSNGVLTFEEESYSGNGRMHISYRDPNGNPALGVNDLLQGLDFEDFDINEHRDGDDQINWEVRYVGGLIKLGTPVELQWGIEYNDEWHWDEETGEDYLVGYTTREFPGMMSWKTVTPDQARAIIKVYEVGNPDPVIEGGWGFNPSVQPEYRSVDDFALRNLPTGSYYFTVQSEADYKEYRNSDVATSDVYHYVNPGTKLAAVDSDSLHWEDDYGQGFFKWAAWLGDPSADYVDGYYVEHYYSPTLDGEYEQFGGSWSRGGNGETREPFGDHFIQDHGVGYYKFRVKVLSSNIEVIANSEWSEFSPALDITKIPEDVTNDLDSLVDQSNNTQMTPDDIREEIQKIDPQDLKAALLTDQENNGATEKLAELEQKAGGQAPVTVTQDASAFNVNDVSVVGANLNNKSQADSDIKLILDKPEENHVIPERYNSSVAVKFSMTLENVENPKSLAVPVKITLPIPNSINPDFLVIIHYHEDGSHELIRPYVYRTNNKFYADFVLTSFSDFVMTQDVFAEVYPDVSMFTFIPPTELTYDGTPKTAAFQVAEGIEGLGEITVRYYDGEGNPLNGFPVNAGTYLVALDVAEGSVYEAITELWDESWMFEIEKADLPAIEIVDVPSTITYGDSFNLSVDGLAGTALPVWEIISGAENATIDQNGKVTVIGAGDFSVKVTKEGDNNYNDVTCIANLSAQKKALTVSAQAEDKAYDGTTTATIKAITVDGLLEGDSVSINIDHAEAVFEDANAGNGKKVIITGFVLEGNDADNYVLNELTVETTASIISQNYENADTVIAWIDAAKELIDAIENEKAIPDNKDAVEQAVKAKQAYDALTESEKAYVGETYAQQIAALYEKAVDFQIIEGADGVYTKDSANGLSFRANGAFNFFKEIKVDGVVISEEHYTAKSGSTIVELSTAYLNTLANGNYSLEVVYEVLGEEHSADYRFTVEKAPVISDDESDNGTSEEDTSDESTSQEDVVSGTETPVTGDNSNVLGWMYTMILSAMALVLCMTSKKNKYRK